MGDPVWIDCIDGFAGLALVVDVRESEYSRYKVQMADRNPESPFWAHDFEVKSTPPVDGGPYDSRPDTLRHIARVRELMAGVISGLRGRAEVHDASKLEDPERSVFDRETPLLRDLTYGGDEYKAALARMKPALDHHYALNSHHPEHFEGGVAGMSLLDLIEMLCDWKAATERHADGSMSRSLEVNRTRFAIGDQLASVLENTKAEMGW